MRKMLMLKEEIGEIPEKTLEYSNPLVGFSLQHGKSVLITPKILRDSSKQTKIKDRTPWYFTHI